MTGVPTTVTITLPTFKSDWTSEDKEILRQAVLQALRESKPSLFSDAELAAVDDICRAATRLGEEL